MCLWAIPCFGESIVVELENDLLYKSDEKYTHGTRITYGRDGFSYAFGQNLYTPSDLEVSSPITNERAYAGIMYFGIIETREYNFDLDTFHQVELAVGVVGENSLAEGAQKLVHDWTDSDEPMGWDYQVEESFLFQLNGRIHTDLYSSKYLNCRLYSSVELGTVFGNMGGGANCILGYNVPRILNKPIMSKECNFSVYWFGDFHQRHIWWNNILNSDYTDVEQVDNVLDIRYGIGVSYKAIELRYTQCDRTKEFEEQETDSSFGSVFIKVGL